MKKVKTTTERRSQGPLKSLKQYVGFGIILNHMEDE